MERKNFSKLILYLLSILCIVVIIAFITNNQSRFIYNVVGIYIVYIVVYYYEMKNIIKTTKLVKILSLLVIFLHLVFGQYLNLYVMNTYFDKVLHVVGTFTIALFIYQAFVISAGIKFRARILQVTIIISFGIAFGALFELLEFFLDIIFKTNHQKDLLDTNIDMLANLIGAIFAGVSLRR